MLEILAQCIKFVTVTLLATMYLAKPCANNYISFVVKKSSYIYVCA